MLHWGLREAWRAKHPNKFVYAKQGGLRRLQSGLTRAWDESRFKSGEGERGIVVGNAKPELVDVIEKEKHVYASARCDARSRPQNQTRENPGVPFRACQKRVLLHMIQDVAGWPVYHLVWTGRVHYNRL